MRSHVDRSCWKPKPAPTRIEQGCCKLGTDQGAHLAIFCRGDGGRIPCTLDRFGVLAEIAPRDTGPEHPQPGRGACRNVVPTQNVGEKR